MISLNIVLGGQAINFIINIYTTVMLIGHLINRLRQRKAYYRAFFSHDEQEEIKKL